MTIALKLLLTKSSVIRKRYNQQLTPAIIQWVKDRGYAPPTIAELERLFSDDEDSLDRFMGQRRPIHNKCNSSRESTGNYWCRKRP